MRALVTGSLFAGLFAALTVYAGNARGLYLSATQIPILPYVLLFVMVLGVNPLFRLLGRLARPLSRIFKPLTAPELLLILTMGIVSAGLSTFGLSAQLVPFVGGLFNRHWNSEQSQWRRYVAPYLNEQYFVSEPGLREAAAAHLDAQRDLEILRRQYVATFQSARAADGEEADDALAGAPQATDVGRQQELAEAVRQQEAVTAQLNRDLAALETRAFEKIDAFRRGLPESERAYPGIFPDVNDTAMRYFNRLGRLVHGRPALAMVLKARAALPAEPGKADQLIGKAVAHLERIMPLGQIEARQAQIQDSLDAGRTERLDLQGKLTPLYQEARLADADNQRNIAKQIESMEARVADLKTRESELLNEQDLLNRELAIVQRVQAEAERLRTLQRELAQNRIPADAAGAVLRESAMAFPAFDASLRRYLAGDIPWGYWLPPLLNWMALIGLTYAVLMAFNLLIFRQWVYNEKLIYPLAKLPEELAGADAPEGRMLPTCYRNALFWAGAATSGFVLGWNLLCASQIVPGLTPIDLLNSWSEYIQTGPLSALVPSAKSAIFFTMIGLSFLIPQRISFSLWFFAVLYMLQLLVICGLGYGVNERSFPMDWLYQMNFRTAEGGGAMMVFSLVVLWKCRRYILSAFMPSAVASLEPGERRELRAASVVFLAGSAAIMFILWAGMKAHPVYVVFYYLIMLLITIGLIRAVTEGGILGFQAWCSPFHLIRNLLGTNKAWTAPALFSPLMIYHAILYLDVKTFIAPAMANAIKIREDTGMERARFHVGMFLSIVLAAVVAIAAEIMMGYDRGADRLDYWFHNMLPQTVLENMSSLARNPFEAQPSVTWWFIAGAVAMTALLFFRRRHFWLPHPLGMIMLVNPIMSTYWFSIMIGWLAKSLVTRYGGQETYRKAKHYFVGLIAGELIVVAIATLVSVLTEKMIQIDLNRN
jgi:hypothetical protein